MKSLEKISKGYTKYLTEMSMLPDALKYDVRDILAALLEKDHNGLLYKPFIITDHSSAEIVYASQNFHKYLQCSAKDVMREGYDIAFSLTHPDDRNRVIEITTDIFKAYFAISGKERLSYKYCNDLRFKRLDRKYAWWLNEITFLKTDEDGRPLLSINTFTDITSIKKDDTIDLSIGRYEEGNDYRVKVAKKYPLLKDVARLSRREVEILKMISDGYLSKQIADKLHISFHTVNTHRQHMLEKTNTCTSGQMVNYAREHGII